jgi:hypothetical protein
MKINPDGNTVAYSSYLGGTGFDEGNAIAVDTAGNAYVSGTTTSEDFPTLSAIQPTLSGGDSDAFVSKVNADGNGLIYSTYLGGQSPDGANGIAVDAIGNAYVTGLTSSTDFPIANAIQPKFHGADAYASNAFVTKINANGSAFVYSTYLGGGSDGGVAIAADGAGRAYVTGYTGSSDFPIRNALQPELRGPEDAFVTKISALGKVLVYSTYVGEVIAKLARALPRTQPATLTLQALPGRMTFQR